YTYTGYTVYFLKDIVKIYNILPLLLKELDILVFKPNNTILTNREAPKYVIR
ncbi:hypothetical protein B0T20DRAFT_365520, partial [Sordaria brevicollis]